MTLCFSQQRHRCRARLGVRRRVSVSAADVKVQSQPTANRTPDWLFTPPLKKDDFRNNAVDAEIGAADLAMQYMPRRRGEG